jgi:uncharacterized membrane protein
MSPQTNDELVSDGSDNTEGSINENKSKSDKTPSKMNSFYSFYHKHTLKIWLAIIIIPIIIFTLGTIFLPEIFYDQVIWPYFWGTIEADAQDQSYGDVTEAYNPVNTMVYAFIVIIVLYWAYRLFKHFRIKIDEKFILAIVPYVLIGGLSRTLEDAELFYSPAVYFFIAPLIYIFIGLVVIGFILLSVLVVNYSKKHGLYYGRIIVGFIFVGLSVFYLITYFLIYDQFSYFLHPIYPVIFSGVMFPIFWKYFDLKKRLEIWAIMLLLGVWFLLINLFIIFQWRTIPAWNDAYSAVNPGKSVELQPFAFVLVFGLTCLFVGLVYVIVRILIPKYPSLKPFIIGVNLILFFGHFLDASATFVAIDYYRYVEKHVLPNFLIELFNSAVVMYVLKALLIILVIYFIDILYKEDFKKNPTMVGLVKIAVLVLGLAPGTRDLMRLAIGV